MWRTNISAPPGWPSSSLYPYKCEPRYPWRGDTRDLIILVQVMSISEGWNGNWLVKQQLRLSTQLTLHHNRNAPICLLISHSVLPPHVNKTPIFLNSSTWGNNIFPNSSRQPTLFWLKTVALDQTWKCKFSSQLLHIWLKTLQYMLKVYRV